MNPSQAKPAVFGAAPHPARRAAARGLPLAACAALLIGCGQMPHQATTRDYYRDAQACRVQSPVDVEVRINQAGISNQSLAAGMDKDQYLQCMQKLGWRQDQQTDPLLKALEKCQAKAERRIKVQPEPGGARLSSSLNQEAFRQCMKQRGFEGEVSVGPLQPADSK
jgi:hypothetical protein